MNMKNEKHSKSYVWAKILGWFAKEQDSESFIGDVKEWYMELIETRGIIYARLWFWYQIVRSIWTYLQFSSYWRIVMFKNYSKIAFRNLKRHIGYSFINIAGLSIGLTCSILILLWIKDELSYDRFHENSNEICSVLIDYDNKGTYQKFAHGALPAALKEEIPEIVNATKLAPLWPLDKNPIRYGDKSFVMTGSVADPAFFEIFTFPFIKGDPQTALSEPNSIVLTVETSKKLFGDEDPLNKTVQFEIWGGWSSVTVSGILEDFPYNSSINYDFVIPSSLMKRFRQSWDSWDDICSPAYVLLQKEVSYKVVNEKVKDLILHRHPESKFTVHLHPLKKIRLYNYSGGGAITYVYIFSSIGILILAIAVLNYMNLSTARSVNRAKEIGIRKVVGSDRSQLIKQFLGESIIVTVIALILTILLLKLLLPPVNNLLKSQLKLDYSGITIFSLIGITIFTGVISGSYPALFLSNFKPVNVLKNNMKSGSKSIVFRKSLVLIQFTISVLLMVYAAMANKQLKYIINRDLGYNKECILNLEMRGNFRQNWPAIKQQLLNDPNILYVTAANTSFISGEKSTNSVSWEGKSDDEEIWMEWYPVDYDYLKTFDMKMAEGRFFSDDYSTDAMEGIVLNEAAIKAMGMESPIGKRFDCYIGNESRQAKIIGVVKDFNFRSLYSEIKPVIFAVAPWWYNEFYIKLKPDNSDIFGTIRFIESKIKEFVPDYPFEYSFIDEDIARLYIKEQRAGILVKYGAFLAVFIACLGLIGLASYDAGLKTKEIGIRKVHGASLSGIVFLMVKPYLKWIFLANLIAWPIAYYSISKWFQNFAYHTNTNLWIFVIAGMIVLFIALISVCYQVIKAALANPADSLRYE